MAEPKKKLQFSPKTLAYIQSLLKNIAVPGTNTNSNISVLQANLQARKEILVKKDIPKTKAEGSYRNIERRRKSGKTKDQEDIERDIKLATLPTWRTDVADMLHTIGNTALTIAGGIALATNPLTTIGAITGGTVGGKAFDKASKYFTGKTWAENVKDRLNLLSTTLPELFNPGTLLGGGLGAGIVGKGIPNLIKMDMPRYGYSPTTKYYFDTNVVGMNGSKIKPTPINEIFEQNRWNRFRDPKYVTELDKIELESHFPEYRSIQEKAMDEGNYLVVPKGFPKSILGKDGRYYFTGDEGSWIQSQSSDFKRKFGNSILKIGSKGGTDLKIEGVINTHNPETFPLLENGVFFAKSQAYADTYNSGKQAPSFWLGFKRPYDMIEGGKKPFLLEDTNIRFVRGVESSPSFKGEFPDQTIKTLHKVWNSDYINNPEVMKILTSNPNKMNSTLLELRESILKNIRSGLNRSAYNALVNFVNSQVKSGKMRPLAGNYYDGFIGRDHALGWTTEKDLKWPFGSNPETYVITKPELASLLIGNNGSFSGTAYSRKQGGKLWNMKK